MKLDNQCHHNVCASLLPSKGLFIYLHSKYIVKILVQSHFEQALEATEPVPETVTQMAVELINNHFVSVQLSKRDECKRYILFHLKTITKII